MENANGMKGIVAHRYVDILTNSGFKALFGDENNKDVVMSIINVLLPEHRKVKDIEYLPTEHQGPIVGVNKEYHYDFMCRDISGTVFIVELQRYEEDDWFKRCVSYACRSYDRQNRKGKDYNVAPVYLIGLMDIEIDHPDKEFWKDRYISEYTFREKESHDLLGETIVIIFAEMANFSKTIEECATDADKMLYVLKNIGKMLDQPAWLQHEVYSRIFRACEIAEFTEDKRIQYERDMYDEKRIKGEMSAARRIGYNVGHKKGLEAGMEKGMEKGIEKGMEKGMEKGKAEVAKRMLEAGMNIELICKLTGLDSADIEAMS